MTKNQSLLIGNRPVGAGLPSYIVAEVGINHNGDMNIAREAIAAAKAAGADAVKFQNYRTEDFVTDRTLTYTYKSQGRQVTEPQYDMFKRAELSFEQLRELKDCSDSVGIDFHSTPTGEDGIRALVDLGVGVLKNGSDYLGNLPLIQAMGRTGLPTVLSTGMATLSDIDEAVNAFRSTGNEKLILLHCVSSYPAPAESLNLAKIPALNAAFDCLVGFSDHSQGVLASVGAVALGACWIEKHFTLDKNLPGPDHWFSCDPAEFSELVKGVRYFETARGNPRLVPNEAELAMRADARLSCVAARALASGAVLAAQDIVFQRPGTGLPPSFAERLIGRRLTRSVTQGARFDLGDFSAH
jgi:N,N'-diacetyllegionaminate synthase